MTAEQTLSRLDWSWIVLFALKLRGYSRLDTSDVFPGAGLKPGDVPPMRCSRCGRVTSMDPCCSCRYRNGGELVEDREVGYSDAVQHFTGHEGGRIAEGFRMVGCYQ